MLPPITDEAADGLYQAAVSADPFTRIPASLLNSSDIYAYECTTGMVWPFEIDSLKSASYSIRIGNRVIYWDNNTQSPVEKFLGDGEKFVVPKNSIVFIKTKEKFRLPNYIAMRFNLKISNVHRGILLGTGPLVDPGFKGHLLIPMHNLTTNEYTFAEGERFVWVEFTKTSPHQSWDQSIGAAYQIYGLDNQFKPFPPTKRELDEWDYLTQACAWGPIRSSIADLYETARKEAEEAKKRVRTFEIIGISGIALGLAAVVISIWAVIFPWADDLTRRITTAETVVSSDLTKQDSELKRVSSELATVRSDGRISDLDARLHQVEDRLKQVPTQSNQQGKNR